MSYVLVATTEDEVRHVTRWLFSATLSPQVEIVLAAPARVLAHIPARVIPARVQLASAPEPPDRNAVRLAGAAVTTGLVVIVIDCEGDFTARIRDPFAAQPVDPAASDELVRWADELDQTPR